MLKIIIVFLLIAPHLYADEVKVNSKAMTEAHNELRKKYNSYYAFMSI